MKFTYTCKKVSLNDSVKAYAEKKVGKLEKFFKEEPEASVTFSVEKKNRCVAEIMLRGANGTLFRAVCEDPDGDMRGAIDEATAQIERKIRKNKTRLAKNLRAEAVLPELPEEFEAHEEGAFDIVRTKRFTVKPMSVEEAILQMNLLGHSFFVFSNTDFGDAIWWASMNLTTVGADIFAVTAVGKILTVLLPTLGMMMFPIFTVYVTSLVQQANKRKEEYYQSQQSK